MGIIKTLDMQDSEEPSASYAQEQVSELLSRMQPACKVRFAKALARGAEFDRHELESVVDADDELYADYQEFLQFPLRFFSGKNSKNFVLFADTDYILKYEELLQVSRDANNLIHNSLVSEHIVPLYSEVEVMYTNDDGEKITSYISLTKLYENASICEYSLENYTDAERTEKALEVFTQMCGIVSKIQDEGLFFVDMKNPNWLVDEDGNIFISDTKSFIKVLEDGTYQRYNPDDPQKFLLSFNYSPNEFLVEGVFSVEKAHVAIMGRNLYQFLSACEISYLLNSEYKYTGIFNDGLGQRFKHLIENSIHGDAGIRPSLKEFKAELMEIRDLHIHRQSVMDKIDFLHVKRMQETPEVNITPFFKAYANKLVNYENISDFTTTIDDVTELLDEYTKCMQLINEIDTYRINNTDQQMNFYVRLMTKRLIAIHSIADYAKMQQLLSQDLLTIKQSQPLTNNIKRLIDKYLAKNNPKGNDIQIAFLKVPIFERIDILTSNSQQAIELRQKISQKSHKYSLRTVKTNPNADDLSQWIDTDLITQAKDRQQLFSENTDSTKENQAPNADENPGESNAPRNR